MMVNIEEGRFYGYLMALAFILAVFGAFLAIIAAIINLAVPSRVGSAFAIVAAFLAFVGTFGVVAGYLVLGAQRETMVGVWVYGFSFFPGLVGSFLTIPKRG